MKHFFNTSLLPGNWKWWFSIITFLIALFVFNPQKWVIIAIVIPILLSLKVSNFEQGLVTNNFKKILIISILSFIFFSIMVYFFENFSSKASEAGKKVVEGLGFGKSIKKDWEMLLLICFWAPLSEELLYRGAIFRPIWNSISLSKKLGKHTKLVAFFIASFGSSFLFMSAHGGEGQNEQLIMIFILGLIACICYLVTGSIYAPVLFHSFNNSYVIWNSNSNFTNPNMQYYSLLMPIAVCLALFIIQKALKPLEKINFKSFIIKK